MTTMFLTMFVSMIYAGDGDADDQGALGSRGSCQPDVGEPPAMHLRFLRSRHVLVRDTALQT